MSSSSNLLNCRLSHGFLALWIFLSWFPGLILSAVVTLESMEIYNTHELFNGKPTVYFACKDEKKTFLPDVTAKNVPYVFKGEESWQPLTELESKKCKRCGIYEQDTLNSDDTFDEWEFCSSEFKDGKYVRFKEDEFNATFLCPQCTSLPGSNEASAPHDGLKKTHIALAIVVSAMVSAVIVVAGVAVYKYWQRRKRQQDQARFLKLFEDGDDIEDELGLGHGAF